jgi:hypothetical protein
MTDLVSAFLTPQTLLLIAGVWAVVEGLNRAGLKKSKVWWRLLPIIPLVLGAGLAVCPGVLDLGSAGWGSKLLYGLIAGGLASQFRKSIKRSVMDKWPNGEKTE